MQKSTAKVTHPAGGRQESGFSRNENELVGLENWKSPLAQVWVVIPAYGRPQLLARALASLEEQGPQLAGVLVINNSCDSETVRVAAEARVPVEVLNAGRNLGTAGGISAGMKEVMKKAAATHVWIMDDDACATPDVLDTILSVAKKAGADVAAPMLVDESGIIRWFPGPLPKPAWNVIRQDVSPEQYLARCGDDAQPWTWAIWASLLVSRRAIETIGYPREDLWSQFSDIEYTLRFTARFKGVLVPRAVCRHLPPAASENASMRPKLSSALQNAAYVSFHLRHGWRWLRHLPGLNYRYLRHFRWQPLAWGDCAAAFFRGAILGQTSGAVR